jgi:copper(I)-binding protein
MKNLLTYSLALLFIGACSQTEQTPEPVLSTDTIEILNGWVRPGNAGMMTAAYFTISNMTNENDSLLSVETEIAVDTQIHESFETQEGTMGMRPVGLVPAPAKSQTELKPGGIHIMIIRPYENVAEGDSVDLLLFFQESGLMEVALPVQSSPN